MPRWPRVLGACLIVTALGCSDDDPLPISDVTFTEGEVGLILPLIADVVAEVDPFAASSAFQGVECLPVPQDFFDVCALFECPPYEDGTVDVILDQCALIDPDDGATLTFDGTLNYSPEFVWPVGYRTLVFRGMPATVTIDVDFDGTQTVVLFVDDLLNDILAECVGSLVEPFDVACIEL